jgi:CDP-diacylglycerol pyrophosphatase
MSAMRRIAVTVLLLLVLERAVAATDCFCSPEQAETMSARQCSLCREAEKQAEASSIFFLKDINPRKPNRWLALPRAHFGGLHHLHDMPAAARAELWAAAIDKAKSMWGDDWGVAYNGEKVRTQCHTHIHIGKMMKHVETGRFIVVSKPSQIPAPAGEGIWVHSAGKKMHVHLGEQTTETVLMR